MYSVARLASKRLFCGAVPDGPAGLAVCRHTLLATIKLSMEAGKAMLKLDFEWPCEEEAPAPSHVCQAHSVTTVKCILYAPAATEHALNQIPELV